LTNNWRRYQEEVATFFRELGLDANTDITMQGTRAKHDIDVVVKSSHVGFEVIWIIECKQWQTKVSKLHVLALRQIVTDVGADRGILLSESRFQSGALEAAALTNVHAMSLAEVRKSASREIISMRLRELYDRLEDCSERYWNISKRDRITHGLRPEVGNVGYSGTQVIDLAHDILAKAFRGIFPIKSDTLGAINITGFDREFNTLEELITSIESLINKLDKKLKEYESKINNS
jgi:restriction system protein